MTTQYLKLWFDETYERTNDMTDFVTFRDLFNSHREWYYAHKLKRLTVRNFAAALREIGVFVEHTAVRIAPRKYKPVYCARCIRLKLKSKA